MADVRGVMRGLAATAMLFVMSESCGYIAAENKSLKTTGGKHSPVGGKAGFIARYYGYFANFLARPIAVSLGPPDRYPCASPECTADSPVPARFLR